MRFFGLSEAVQVSSWPSCFINLSNYPSRKNAVLIYFLSSVRVTFCVAVHCPAWKNYLRVFFLSFPLVVPIFVGLSVQRPQNSSPFFFPSLNFWNFPDFGFSKYPLSNPKKNSRFARFPFTHWGVGELSTRLNQSLSKVPKLNFQRSNCPRSHALLATWVHVP